MTKEQYNLLEAAERRRNRIKSYHLPEIDEPSQYPSGIFIMHERLWAGSARLIIPADGNIMRSPVSLNIRLLAVLCQTNGQSARVYRITCMITAVLSIYFSLLLLLIPHVFIFIDGNVADVLYGPLLYYLPERVNDILIIAFFTQAHTIWQFLPGPSNVQWIHLTKRDICVSRQLILAYTIPGHIDLLAMIMYDVLSYIVRYGLFSFCAIKIRIDLKTYLINASEKTALMQQRFFRLQLVQ
ncbi:hypothetical protein PRIPAC_82101, partial [Pristionchus pacificus]|uniref:Uncharacterized protein n=1 Tax=Pristionchus pacificus TaxID=54126 RepID=A0A2A6C3Z7_PRIPA